MKSIYQTKNPEETMNLGFQLASRLHPSIPVLLFGDLGAGKTYFSKGLAKGLGISSIIKSPTFTYLKTYPIPFKPWTFFHYDLYRLKNGDDFESIGLYDSLSDSSVINLIEWADRMTEWTIQNYVRVDFKIMHQYHELTIQFQDSEIVPNVLVDQYWDLFSTPLHVRAHCKKVADICLQIGRAYIKKNILVDLNLLNTAGLLHDMARICDFITMDRHHFSEDITEDKWEKWVDLRRQFKGINHANIAQQILLKDGFKKTADMILYHDSSSIIDHPQVFSQLEIAILFYADKRVKHNQVVDLKERFRDGCERHGKENDNKRKVFFEEVESKTYELEKKLFSKIDIQPNEII